MIVQYWNREDVPDQIAEPLATFRERNPEMRQRVFDERTAAELIGERFGARHAEAFAACAVPAMQADYFRYCAVYALGGVYVDATFACERPLAPLLEDEGILFEQPGGPVLNGLFAFRAPGHPLLAAAIEIATRNIEKRLCENVALTTGPAIFTGLVQLHRGGSLEAMRQSAAPRWASLLESCWEPLVESFADAAGGSDGLARAFEGVRISTRSEMLTWVRKRGNRPRGSGHHWAHWQGSVFRKPRSPTSP